MDPLKPFMVWVSQTPLHDFMIHWPPAHPAAETLHFIGLCLLFGSIGLLDLRGLGLFKEMPLEPLHKLVPIGLLGFLINVATGIAFIASDPTTFIGNWPLYCKLALFPLAALNGILFEFVVFRRMRAGVVEVEQGMLIRIMSAFSLLIWCAVVVLGRWIPFV